MVFPVRSENSNEVWLSFVFQAIDLLVSVVETNSGPTHREYDLGVLVGEGEGGECLVPQRT